MKAALAQVLSADTVTQAIRAAYGTAEVEKGVLDGFKLLLQSGQRFVDKLRAVLRSLYTEAANEGATEAAQAAGGDVPTNLSDILRQADIWINELVDTQIDRIGEAISEGVAQGWPIDRTTDAVNAVIDDAKRAWLITETEYARAMTLAARATYKANNVPMVQWFEQPDACPRCQENFAVSPIPITDSWPNGNVPVHPHCFPAGTIVSGPRVLATTAREYEGDLVTVVFESGNNLAVTPNHPILTRGGWVAAGQLNEGSDVLRALDAKRIAVLVNPDDHQAEARIEDVAAAVGKAGEVATVTVPVSPVDFHGDGAASKYVEVVLATGHPQFTTDADGGEKTGEICLVGAERPTALGFGESDTLDVGYFSSPSGIVGGGEHGGTLGSLRAIPSESHGAGAPPNRNASLLESAVDNVSVDAVTGGQSLDGLAAEVVRGKVWPQNAPLMVAGDTAGSESTEQNALADASSADALLERLAGLVEGDRVVQLLWTRGWTGHVFNLETVGGWYCANGIIAHNCRCAEGPYIPVPGSRP